MKKTIKVTPQQFQKIIQTEAIRQKKILELNSKKELIISQLNEMYEMENDVDEGWLGDMFKGSEDEWRAKYLAWRKEMQRRFGEDDIPPHGKDLEDAVAAARKYQDFRVVKKNGVWVPTHHISGDTGGAFGGAN